jgi:hypothetical protein
MAVRKQPVNDVIYILVSFGLFAAFAAAVFAFEEV